MAWDEWEQLKTEAAGRQSTHMQLNRLPDDEGGGNATPPSTETSRSGTATSRRWVRRPQAVQPDVGQGPGGRSDH